MRETPSTVLRVACGRSVARNVSWLPWVQSSLPWPPWPPLSSPGSGAFRRPPLSSRASAAGGIRVGRRPPLSSPGSGVARCPPLSSPGSTEAAAGADDVAWGDAFPSSPGVPVAVGFGLPAAAVNPGNGAVGVLVAESSGRSLLALPGASEEELTRIGALAARAAVPVRRIPAIESARAVFVLMVQP